ncbi:MAG: transcription-repair coupling factor [Candidatus Izimaplasma sp.]|nr:transcription-repair coupling factor [Candidatus Izimaplasma bacterium]
MNKIYDYISNTSFFKNILKTYDKKDEIHITNTNDDISLLAVYSIFKEVNHSVVIVTPNIYNAQKVFDKLSNIFDDNKVSFFPQDEFMTTEMLAMSKEFKLERINTIKNIIDNEKMIIVTNTTGYIKSLPPIKKWETAIIRLKEGSIVDLDKLLETLVSYGYTRTETVTKQGEFSLRGSILDIYPLSEVHPVRIEFFDDEVETLRFFDIDSQRSKLRTEQLEILPMYEFFYDEKEFNEIKSIIEDKLATESFNDKAKKRIEEELLKLELHDEIDNLSRYASLLNQETETLADYTKNNLVIFWDYKKIKNNYETVITDITDWYANTGDYPKIGFELVKNMHHIYRDKTLYLDVFGANTKQVHNIDIRAKETPLYNNNIHMLMKDIKKYDKFTTVIMSFHSQRALKKFTDLLNNKQAYYIIGSNDNIVSKRLNLIVSDNTLSFEFFDINTILLTENNLYKQSTKKKVKYRSTIKDAKKLSSIKELKKGDLIVHYDHGIGRFLGIEQMTLGDMTNDYIHLAYKGDDSLYIPVENINLIQKYVGSEGARPKIHRLGGTKWAKTKQRVKNKVKNIAGKLIKLYAAREEARGFAFSPESELQRDFEDDFPYQETEDQLTAIEEIKTDMEEPRPMDRLLCGDVGYGKTEVAMRAAFKAVLDNKQVAYLAPTTVLSRQHFYTFKERFDKYGIKIGLLNRFVTRATQRHILTQLGTGDLDIIIGTHRILSKDVKYNDLGLLIIDEEQRFGVEHKEKIKEYKVSIDVLSLSATPIPRTLQMSIMGVKDMSLLETPPKNRYPIQTYVLERNQSITRDAIQREMAREGQVFYLYNRVRDIEVIANQIQRLVPEAKVVFAHGKMSRLALEEVIQAFIDKEFDVLVSTTIIETGIDIPNANTLIIHDSDRLGLSQLYQIRGRVGRSDKIAYAYLLYQKHKQLNDEAVKRLKVIKEFTELGSGFKIAMRDLSIRGAGDVLGTEQSGFMDSVGIDLFLDMLKDEIATRQDESTEEKPTETDKNKSPIKVNVDKYIDSNYIKNDYIKIEMHKKISEITSEEDITQLLEEFNDRFGLPSKEIKLYMYEKLFEHLAIEKDIEKVLPLKNTVKFVFSKEASNNINGEYLFEKASSISKFIRFNYKDKQLSIFIDTLKLPKHYLFYIVELLQAM